jgi:signal transduction histidine kinase
LSEFDFHTEFASVEKRNETPHLGAEVHGDDLSSVEKQIGRSQRKAKFTVADGTQRSFGYSISVPENIPGSGPGHGYIVLFRDVTEMEELRLHMHRLEKLEALNILIAGVAHEIKNPVAGIKSVASVLIDMFEAEDERREYVSRILDETGRVIRLVQDFFSFSRPSKPRRELLEITDCIGGVVRLMDDTAKQHSIRIASEISPDLPLVRVDRDQVKQIILNLVTNSIQAVEDEGTIEITADKMYYRVLEKDCLCVRVHDSGPGFSDEVRNKLFDPFFTTKQSGTGLGLHISQNIMLEHGGRMEALNHPIGGAEICLYFPLEDGSE